MFPTKCLTWNTNSTEKKNIEEIVKGFDLLSLQEIDENLSLVGYVKLYTVETYKSIYF